MLTSMLERLERCQKSLNDFLEEKRNSFPRFYFVGDEDLLAILGQANKPSVVQTHLKKLFAGIHSVNFDSEGKNILTMNSVQGEVVPLKNPIRISSEVEGWLNQLHKEMKNTLKLQLEECVAEGRKANGSLDPLKYPSQVEHVIGDLYFSKKHSQVLCLGEAVLFCEKCESAIRGNNLDKFLSSLKNQLESYTQVDKMINNKQGPCQYINTLVLG